MGRYQERKKQPNAENEKPRSFDTSWRDLALIVYGWTDSRERDLDRNWWNTVVVGYPPLPQLAAFSASEPTVASTDVEQP